MVDRDSHAELVSGTEDLLVPNPNHATHYASESGEEEEEDSE